MLRHRVVLAPRLRVLTTSLTIGCGSGDAADRDAAMNDSLQADIPSDAAPACDVTKPFGTPSPVEGINTIHPDTWGWQTADKLTIYFARDPYGGNLFDLYVATRATPDEPFSSERVLEPSTQNTENRPIVTGDGLTLLLEFTNNSSGADIEVATRAAANAPFSSHSPLPVITTTAAEFNPWISEDGLALYFTSDRDGFNDIFASTRASTNDAFSTPVAVSELNSSYGDYMGAVSRDGLEIIFESTRDTNFANGDIFHALRSVPNGPFGPPTKLVELSDPTTIEYPSWISPDRCEVMFTSNRSGGLGKYDVWIARRPL
jgi:Tol biopolymer transport system component